MRTTTNSSRAFSLVEILIAVGIIALFVTLPALAYSNYSKSSRDEKRKSDVMKISQALEQYKAQKGVYPINLNDLVTEGFLPELPVDPKHNQQIPGEADGVTYGYAYETDSFEYTLSSRLESEVPFTTGGSGSGGGGGGGGGGSPGPGDTGPGVFIVKNKEPAGKTAPVAQLTEEAVANPTAVIPTETIYLSPTSGVVATITGTPCNGTIVCSGTCQQINGRCANSTLGTSYQSVVNGCEYTTRNGKTNCTQVPAPNQACTISSQNCTGQLVCVGTNCLTPTLTPTHTPTNTPSPTPVRYAQIDAGYYHTCAVTTTGAAKCWGENSSAGKLGNNTSANSSVPVNVTGLSSGVAQISAGKSHTCARMTNGTVKCWGSGNEGQLGNNALYSSSRTPVDVLNVSGAIDITTGGWHTCALLSNGSVKCWGLGSHYELGNNSTANSAVAVNVLGLDRPATDIEASDYQTCARMNDGGMRCWGSNREGEHGGSAPGNTPTAKLVVNPIYEVVTAIGVGGAHNCYRTSFDEVKCLGYNDFGELGDGTNTTTSTPVAVVGLGSGIVQVLAGDYHTCSRSSGGGVQCWGANQYIGTDPQSGQLGNNSNVHSPYPVAVVGLSSGVAQLSTGYYHNCVVMTDGTAKCWGLGLHGELGNNTTISSKVPVTVN